MFSTFCLALLTATAAAPQQVSGDSSRSVLAALPGQRFRRLVAGREAGEFVVLAENTLYWLRSDRLRRLPIERPRAIGPGPDGELLSLSDSSPGLIRLSLSEALVESSVLEGSSRTIGAARRGRAAVTDGSALAYGVREGRGPVVFVTEFGSTRLAAFDPRSARLEFSTLPTWCGGERFDRPSDVVVTASGGVLLRQGEAAEGTGRSRATSAPHGALILIDVQDAARTITAEQLAAWSVRGLPGIPANDSSGGVLLPMPTDEVVLRLDCDLLRVIERLETPGLQPWSVATGPSADAHAAPEMAVIERGGAVVWRVSLPDATVVEGAAQQGDPAPVFAISDGSPSLQARLATLSTAVDPEAAAAEHRSTRTRIELFFTGDGELVVHPRAGLDAAMTEALDRLRAAVRAGTASFTVERVFSGGCAIVRLGADPASVVLLLRLAETSSEVLVLRRLR